MQNENKNLPRQEILARLTEAQVAIETALDLLGRKKEVKKRKTKTVTRQFDFELNPRTYVKRYGKDLSGPKKAVLLIAYLCKGKTNVEIELSEVIKLWNKMKDKSLLGYEFNGKYTTEAKTQGWIDSKKSGKYYLRSEWKNAFG